MKGKGKGPGKFGSKSKSKGKPPTFMMVAPNSLPFGGVNTWFHCILVACLVYLVGGSVTITTEVTEATKLPRDPVPMAACDHLG